MAEGTTLIAINEGIIDRVLDQQQLTIFELLKLLELIKPERACCTTDGQIGDDIEFHPAFCHRRQKRRQIAGQHDGV
ncbi:hypothetical protein D9M69_668680 [compost metagenome]